MEATQSPERRPEWPLTRTAGPQLATTVERRGRWWVFGSFLLCPCHLPLTLGVLLAVLGGTSAGAALREHMVPAGVLVSSVWVAGTAYGFVLLRRAKALGGTCPTRVARRAADQRRTTG